MTRIFYLFLGLATLLCPLHGFAVEDPGSIPQEVGVRPVLGNRVNLSRVLVNSDGRKVRVGDLIAQNRPIILVPAYFRCPRLCGLVHEGVLSLLNQLSLSVGSDFTLATVSFDPRDTPEAAKEYADRYQKQYRDPQRAKAGWEFLVGPESDVKALMNEIGFLYHPDGEEFAHSSAIFILTPDGEISQYFTGIEFSAFDVKLALIEAAKGEIGSPLDHILLYCFRFDDKQGKYTWAAYTAVRVGSGIGFLLLVFLLGTLWSREGKSKEEKKK